MNADFPSFLYTKKVQNQVSPKFQKLCQKKVQQTLVLSRQTTNSQRKSLCIVHSSVF